MRREAFSVRRYIRTWAGRRERVFVGPSSLLTRSVARRRPIRLGALIVEGGRCRSRESLYTLPLEEVPTPPTKGIS